MKNLAFAVAFTVGVLVLLGAVKVVELVDAAAERGDAHDDEPMEVPPDRARKSWHDA